MLISEKMNEALNHQITSEFGASHKYLAMSHYFRHKGMKYFAAYFQKQSEEERGHGHKIAKYIDEVGGRVMLESIPQPQGDYKNVRTVIEAALESEMTVTRQINDLVSLAESEKDYATRSFLNWFVDEQVEEVDTMTELLQWAIMAGDANLFQLESRLRHEMQGEGA